MLTQARLRQVLHYNESTGVFTWAVTVGPRAQIGSVAGHDDLRYRVIRVDGTKHMAHVLAWLYVTGRFPSDEIDHFNGDGFDNRFSNLREATRKQNMENTSLFSCSTSGYRGVTWYKRNQKWGASAFHNGRRHFAGLFDSREDAAEAARLLRDRLFTHHKTPYAA